MTGYIFTFCAGLLLGGILTAIAVAWIQCGLQNLDDIE